MANYNYDWIVKIGRPAGHRTRVRKRNEVRKENDNDRRLQFGEEVHRLW